MTLTFILALTRLVFNLLFPSTFKCLNYDFTILPSWAFEFKKNNYIFHLNFLFESEYFSNLAWEELVFLKVSIWRFWPFQNYFFEKLSIMKVFLAEPWIFVIGDIWRTFLAMCLFFFMRHENERSSSFLLLPF